MWFSHWNRYQNEASLAWFCSANTWSDQYKTGWLQVQGLVLISFQQARTTSFQVNNKAILSGISVFTLVKQGYINKTAFPWNLSIPCIILCIVPFHVLITSNLNSVEYYKAFISHKYDMHVSHMFRDPTALMGLWLSKLYIFCPCVAVSDILAPLITIKIFPS